MRFLSELLGSVTGGSRDNGLAGGAFFYWVDHTVRFSTNTGMQRVTRLLARSLIGFGAAPIFVCWDARRKSLRRATRSELRALAKHGGPRTDANSAAYAQAGQLLPEAALVGRWLLVPEVTHITYHKRPLTAEVLDFAAARGLKTAWIFYDAVPLRTPGYESVRQVHADYMEELLRADLVFPISQFSGGELADFWGPDAGGRVRNRPCVLAGEFPDVQRVTRYDERPGTIRLLSVGSIEPRKNHLTMLSAFERLCREHPSLDVELALLGNVSGELHGMIQRTVRRNPKVRYLGYVDDATLARQYQGAHFTVFPSVAEGFGLPILESLWHGKPCICANFGSMAEVAADGGCLMVDTHFAGELYSAMRTLVTEASLRRRLGEEAVSRPIKSWLDYATEIEHHMELVHETVRLG